MSALTKKHHTDDSICIVIKKSPPLELSIPSEIAERLIQDYGNEEETVSLDDFLNTIPNHPGLILKSARQRAGLTQTLLSKMTGISQANIAHMERGERPIGKVTAKKMARVLKTDYRIFL